MTAEETSKQPNEMLSEKILKPLQDVLIERHKEMDEFLRVVTYSLSEMQGLPRLVRVLSKKSEEQIQHADSVANTAKSEIESGFATVFNFAAIFTWSALETAIRDTAVNWLLHFPQSRQQEKILRLKIPLIEYEELQPDERMRYVLNILENDLGAAFKPGVAKFEAVLKEIGLGGSVDEQLRKDLLELAAVRNVLVHKVGIADQRFVRSCPWFGAEVGKRVSVSRDLYMAKYRKQAFEYAVVVAERVEERLKISRIGQ